MHTRLLVLALFVAACGSTPSEPPHGAPPKDAPARDAGADAKLDLSGTLSFEGTTTATTVFVSVKDPSHPGPPLAAKQIAVGPFPIAFTLGDADRVQMSSEKRPMPDKVVLTARLDNDADGNGMTKTPADPVAVVETPSTATGLTLTLVSPP